MYLTTTAMESSLTKETRKWMYEFDWHLTNRCQFNCVYCHPQIKRVLNVIKSEEPDIEMVCKRFDDIGPSAILMSGGEPFLYPNFVELCEKLTQKHHIAINTNLLSDDVYRFAKTVPSNKVARIVAAIHILERERRGYSLEDFVDKLTVLQDNHFDAVALYVLYPPLLSRAKKDIEYLTSIGCRNIQAKVFKGVYNGKVYPAAYTDVEKELITELSGTYQFNSDYLTSSLSFEGELCTAGMSSFKVMVDGTVHRCATVNNDHLGNLYDGTFTRYTEPMRCTAKKILVLSQCKAFLVKKEE